MPDAQRDIELRDAKREIHRLSRELERYVGEQGKLLDAARKELKLQITERRRAEQQIEAVQAEIARGARQTTLGVFAASIAHEINQPLTGAVANCEAALRWLATKPPNFKEAQKTLKHALADATRIGSVVRRVRALLTKAPPKFVAIDVNEVIREALQLTRREQDSVQVSVRTKLAKLARVKGDWVQLQQAMRNLILNALEAMSANKRRPRKLLITSRMNSDGEVVVAVADTGPGLAPVPVSRLFDPFFTTKAKGMGMGLTISFSIIEAHGGHLWASPNNPRGAVFRFKLPACCEGVP